MKYLITFKNGKQDDADLCGVEVGKKYKRTRDTWYFISSGSIEENLSIGYRVFEVEDLSNNTIKVIREIL